MSDTQTPSTDAPAPDATPQPTSTKPKEAIVDRVIAMSDRAIQRVTGGNAFLRGRLYARRKSVDNLKAKGKKVSGSIQVRSQDEPYETVARIDDEGNFLSECTCPGHRGETGHCKHVAALIVALRDRERPPKPKREEGSSDNAGNAEGEGGGGGKRKRRRKKKKSAEAEADAGPAVPQTVSVGGKRRRSRRRRRGGSGSEKLELLSGRELGGAIGESRGAVDAWLPPDALPRPHEVEYRVTVRPSSLSVTPVISGTKNAVPILDALNGFNTIPVDERRILRALSRHVLRGQPATAELRGEDASEVLSMLESAGRVLLEPASMELRFSDEALRPTIELDTVGDDTLRTKVNFCLEGSGRRFQLSAGAWFEGTPGWHIDASDGVARPLVEQVTPAWLTRLRSSPALVHPLASMERLLGDHIPRVAAALNADLPALESIADLVDAQPVLQIWANGDIADAVAVVKVVYEEQTLEVPVLGFPSPLHIEPPAEEGGRPRVIRRDVGAELNVVQTLMNHGFEADEDRLVIRGAKAVDFWSAGITELPEEWERYIPDDLAEVKVRTESVSAQMRVSSGVDWLSLDMQFTAGGSSVSTEELRACLESGRHIVKLEDGSYAPVDPSQVGELLAAMAEIYAGQDGKRVPLSQAGRIQSLIGMIPDAKVTPKAKGLFKKLENIDEVPKVAKPRSIKATLRPYQKVGFNWLAFVHDLASGGILADDMGLGKTLQTICLLVWAKSQDKKKKLSIVVAPTSVVPNWQREFAKFAPTMKTIVWQGAKRHDKADEVAKADVMFTSYALLRRDEEFLNSLNLRYVILDEAQHIKNPGSHTAKAAKQLKSERRLALTGTPIENRLSELWSIFDFASPGLLGDLKSFEEKVARPIDRGDMETARRLRSTIQPFVLRRLKLDVAADLPPKIEQERIVPMSDAQSSLYKATLQEVRKSLMSEVEKKGVSKVQIQILAALTRLRQVACDPRLMKLSNQEFTNADSAKLEALRELVANAVEGGHRVLVFSQFVTMLGHIREALEEDGVKYEYLDGSTKDRIERVDRFNADESLKVFLISLKAGGTGLNLTGADTVVHFDPWWNPAVEDQATDRAHRIGQTKNVNVYRLIAQGSVEEKILELSAKKRTLMENVLSTEGSPLKGLTKKDVDSLFSD
ncbi:MAG: SNF2-related protein [Polyangiales bacterium]